MFKSNLLDHIGAHSSFAVRTNRLPWPGCFDPMATVWSLHRSERFQVRNMRFPLGLAAVHEIGEKESMMAAARLIWL